MTKKWHANLRSLMRYLNGDWWVGLRECQSVDESSDWLTKLDETNASGQILVSWPNFMVPPAIPVLACASCVHPARHELHTSLPAPPSTHRNPNLALQLFRCSMNSRPSEVSHAGQTACAPVYQGRVHLLH